MSELREEIERLNREIAGLKRELKDVAKYDLHSLLLERDSQGQIIDELRAENERWKNASEEWDNERQQMQQTIESYEREVERLTQVIRVVKHNSSAKHAKKLQSRLAIAEGKLEDLSLQYGHDETVWKSRLAAAVEALEEADCYLEHKDYCHSFRKDGITHNCDCGIDAVKKQVSTALRRAKGE